MRLNGSVGTRWVRGNIPDAEARESNDFYPTPPEGTRALLAVETFKGPIWEPACGDGAISKVLIGAGHEVVSTDLVDRGYGTPRVDFLMEQRLLAPNVITNPPFKNAEAFLARALDLGATKVALLCRLAWLEGKARRAMFESTWLSRVWVFSARLKIWRNGMATPGSSGGLIAMAWFVWERGYRDMPRLGWIEPDEKPFTENLGGMYREAYALKKAVP
jgi:hypothetical protein